MILYKCSSQTEAKHEPSQGDTSRLKVCKLFLTHYSDETWEKEDALAEPCWEQDDVTKLSIDNDGRPTPPLFKKTPNVLSVHLYPFEPQIPHKLLQRLTLILEQMFEGFV